MRILIVEDEVRLADMLRRLLHRSGYTTDVCHDGAAGLDNALSGIYDLLVLDVMLPGMDGFTLCKELRKRSETIGVIMLTARTQEMDKITGLMTGADDYVTKPFSPAPSVSATKSPNSTEDTSFPDVRS